MKPVDRYRWLYARAAKERSGLDILFSDFVDQYAEATGAKLYFQMWGAHKCPQLGRDLAYMAKWRYLRRARIGLSSGAWQPGFPKWVWSYRCNRTELNDSIMRYKDEEQQP